MGCQKYISDEKQAQKQAQKKSSTARLLYVTIASDESDWPSFRHSHPFTELFYVRGGEGTFLIDDDAFPIQNGDLLIINPHTFHTEISSEGAPLRYIALGVEGLCFIPADQKNYLILDHTCPKPSLLYYFQAMREELAKQREGYADVCAAMLEILIIELRRMTGVDAAFVLSGDEQHELSRLKRYIDIHYQEAITLDQLAAMAHLNKYYLVHRFTETYGQSPISYLNACRIRVSCDLLAHTDHSIAQIARLAGFSSQCYFAQSFKKHCGISAREYRGQERMSKERGQE